ncbi:unnamed protein product, partial [Didymodactylos carnosus]
LPNLTVISYPKSATFLIYKGEFSPADDIVNVSVMIPITDHGSDVYVAQIVHLNEGQVRLGQELKYTQQSLNSTISRVNNIAMAVNALNDSVMYLARELGELKLLYQQSLLYSAMNDMLNNRPTLSYVHNRDMDVLIASVLNDTDLYINTTYAEYGLAQLLTEHLFFQHISFVSSKNYNTPNKDEI